MMITMVDFLRVGFVLAVVLISHSACQTKCLTNIDEVKEILASKIPPINDSRMRDNYYNISRALYPSVDLPALYVRVTIQFLKDYQNGTKSIDDQKKALSFTWSKACSYVSGRHLSLNTMSVFSLFTIYPQRRQTELVMTVPPICRSSPYARNDGMANETWRYIVSTLEDVIIYTKISDPRTVTVSCVVNGHEGNIAEYPNIWYFYWFILGSSFLASLGLSIFSIQSMNDNMNKSNDMRRVYGAALRTVAFFTPLNFFAVSIAVISSHLISQLDIELLGYPLAYLFFSVVSLFIGWKRTYIKVDRAAEGGCAYELGAYLIFPFIFQAIHHFSWVVCGIISEPFWAIPIFLLECLFFASILFAFFLYEKEFVNRKRVTRYDHTFMGSLSDCLIKAHLILCWVSFILVLITVALIAINNGNAVSSPTAGALESVLTVILFWLLKNSKFDFWSSMNKNRNRETSV